jgi:hypothetical protein
MDRRRARSRGGLPLQLIGEVSEKLRALATSEQPGTLFAFKDPPVDKKDKSLDAVFVVGRR